MKLITLMYCHQYLRPVSLLSTIITTTIQMIIAIANQILWFISSSDIVPMPRRNINIIRTSPRLTNSLSICSPSDTPTLRRMCLISRNKAVKVVASPKNPPMRMPVPTTTLL